MKKLFTLGAALVVAALAVAAWPAAAIEQNAVHFLAPDQGGLPLIAFGGMLVNASSLNSIFTGLKTLFNNALKATPGQWQLTAMEVPSTAAGEDYAWLSRFPKFRKWIGDKVVKNIAAGKYYRVNEDWETTIAVKRNDIDDDRLGLYNIQAKGAGESAGELNDIIVDDLKNGAFVQPCLDGQYFYDTDHLVGDTSVSNKGTVALSCASKAAAVASYGAARAAMMKFKDEEGMPLRLVPDVLEVPPALEATARTLCEKDKLDDNSPNPYQGTAKVIVNPALTIAEVLAKEAEKSASPATSQAVVADATLSEQMSDSPLGDKESGESMAVIAVPVGSALPAVALALIVRSKVQSFRRAGRAWGTTAETVSVDEFSDEQVEALLADPMLDVVVVTE